MQIKGIIKTKYINLNSVVELQPKPLPCLMLNMNANAHEFMSLDSRVMTKKQLMKKQHVHIT